MTVRWVSLEWTCRIMPVQAEGRLADGRWFYFHSRHSHASIGIGATLDEAIDDSDRNEVEVENASHISHQWALTLIDRLLLQRGVEDEDPSDNGWRRLERRAEGNASTDVRVI